MTIPLLPLQHAAPVSHSTPPRARQHTICKYNIPFRQRSVISRGSV